MIDIEKQIGLVNEELWAFFESATRTVRERKYGLKQEGNTLTKNYVSFIACKYLRTYSTNIQKPTLLHLLLN